MPRLTNVIAIAMLILSAAARGAPVFTEVNSPGAVGELDYVSDVSGSDLLHGLTGDIADSAGWAGAGAPALNDGVHGDTFSVDGTTSIAWPNLGSFVTYDLGTGSGLGWDITEIQSIAAWVNVGFGDQGYTVATQLVGAGSFVDLATVAYEPTSDGGATKVTLTDDGAGPNGALASGVEFIRFTANSVNGGANAGRFTFREIDVFGQHSGDDETLPILSTLSPAHNTSDVGTGTNLVATFSEAIAIGTGNITIVNLTDATQSTIAITDATQVSNDGAVLTIDPAANLVPNKTYAIQIGADAIDDLAGNSFAGIDDEETWNFTTAAPDFTDPTIASLDPANGASEVAHGNNLVATFDEPIAIGSGDITIVNISDATQSIIAITDATQVAVAGAVLMINPAADLDPSKFYAIQIDATAIDDLAGNSFAGIADNETWSFTTAELSVEPIITLVSSSSELEYMDDVSSSDLLHGLTATDVAGWNAGGGATPVNLNDGTHGTSFDDVAGDAVATIAWTTIGATATFDLGIGEGGAGWDITSIQSIAAWNSAAFGNQGYTIELQLVDAGDFIPLATVDEQPLTDVGATKVTLTHDSGVLARGVQFIRFTANSINAGANGGAFTFREIDVEGVESGPQLPFAITEIVYSPEADTVTLTWRSRASEMYIAKYSLEMGNWDFDIGDGLTMEDNDENPDDGDHLTMTFPLTDGLEILGDLFFRIEQQ